MDNSQNSDHPGIVKPPADSPPTPLAADAVQGIAAPPVEDAEAAPPLTPLEWLKQNGFYVAILGALIAFIVVKVGWVGLWQWCLVAVGLGFVIFIHELGHFLTAKWCDVHVQTFSLGFGPALPGCSFRYGETLYKIALIPLGGYVGMVGEGTELEGNDDYPRSFKNKTVGQRMLIISAGVFMNVLFGCLAFVLVYRFNGIERPTMDLGMVEAGGPSWKEGVRSGSRVTKIGKSVRLPFTSTVVWNPFFDDLKLNVALSGTGEQLAFATKKIGAGGGDFEGFLTPRCDKSDPTPVIGVGPAPQLVLFPERAKSVRVAPVLYHSAAAAARVLDVAPGTDPVEATDPDDPEKITPLAHGWPEVAQRLRKLVGKPFVLRVRSKGAAGDKLEEITIASEAGFHWDDVIAGTTDPDQSDRDFDPFIVSKLDPDEANTQKRTYDYFQYQRRMRRLEGKPIILQVHRKGAASDAPLVNVFVPPAFHRTLGARMRMGEVSAIRNNSPASTGGVQPGDVITHVTMLSLFGGKAFGASEVLADLGDFDPCRLPSELSRVAARKPGLKLVFLTVNRPNPPGNPQNGDNNDDKHKASKEVTVGPLVWDDSWDFDMEYPSQSTASLAIAQLGVAYRVDSTVVKVEANSPADKAGLQDNDEIIEIATREAAAKSDAPGSWRNWLKLEATRGDEKRYDRWASIDFLLQDQDYPEVRLKVRRLNSGGVKEVKTIPEDAKAGVALEEDPEWPNAERGLLLSLDTRLQKADSLWEALQFGVSRTAQFILEIYQSIRSLATGRVSPDQMQGPVNIAQMAYGAASDIPQFILFLGMISVNLAVVNFLPIPVLDGGHMVFLIYEKLRGKPASETVQKYAMLLGLCLIGLMLLFVIYKEVLMPVIQWVR